MTNAGHDRFAAFVCPDRSAIGGGVFGSILTLNGGRRHRHHTDNMMRQWRIDNGGFDCGREYARVPFAVVGRFFTRAVLGAAVALQIILGK